MTINTKYEFTGISKVIYGHVIVKQIRALKDFGAVKKGELGGWIEGKMNLSVDNLAWVGVDAMVYDNAWVGAGGLVYGGAEVFDTAQVMGNSRVYGRALVYGDAKVSGNAKVYGHAILDGTAEVCGNAQVFGDTKLDKGLTKGTKKPS